MAVKLKNPKKPHSKTTKICTSAGSAGRRCAHVKGEKLEQRPYVGIELILKYLSSPADIVLKRSSHFFQNTSSNRWCMDRVVRGYSLCGVVWCGVVWYRTFRDIIITPAVCLFVGCLTPQQHASVSQGRISSDNLTCCHTEIEVADPTFYLTQSQYTDTGPTSPSADPITPGGWQGSHWSANF